MTGAFEDMPKIFKCAMCGRCEPHQTIMDWDDDGTMVVTCALPEELEPENG